MEAIVVALLASTIPSWFAYRASKHSKNVDQKTSTNHGLEPWQYLEMVADVRDSVLDVKEDLVDVKAAFAEHTAQDARNFDELKGLIKEQP